MIRPMEGRAMDQGRRHMGETRERLDEVMARFKSKAAEESSGQVNDKTVVTWHSR
jgi:hypothetical protein